MLDTANNKLIELANSLVPVHFPSVMRSGVPASVSQWIDSVHVEIRAPYTLNGRKQVFEHMSKLIIRDVGWSALAVSCITLAWSLYYGQHLYVDMYGHFPVFVDSFIQASMEADTLSDVLSREW
jgi:hypothetical protein